MTELTEAKPLQQLAPAAWLLTSHRAGDNSQVVALAELLDWPFQVKKLVYRRSKLLSKLISKQLMGVTLAGIDRQRSSRIEPPWPDVVISAGRDNEPVARWIKNASGGRTRLVHMGRPWAPLSAFDLIVTTPQYFLPPRPNILMNDLPLHRVTPERLRRAATQWQAQFAHLRRPYTVVLVGGNSGPLVLTRSKARRLGRLVNELAQASGGSVLISNSARTPDVAFDDLCHEIEVPAHIYRWRDGAQENPYFGYLALADQLVVTSESVSMLAEASVTGKPLFLFDVGDDPAHGGVDTRPWWQRYLQRLRYRSLRHWLTLRFGPQRMHRDIGNIQRQLTDSGRAVWLGATPPTARPVAIGHDVLRDAKRAVERVRDLFPSLREPQ